MFRITIWIIILIIILNKTGECRIKTDEILNSASIPAPATTIKPLLPPPPDKFYYDIEAKIIEQKIKWQKELGWYRGMQKTADWLNRKLPEYPLPPEIENSVERAEFVKPDTLHYTFKNGHAMNIIEWVSAPYEPDYGYIKTVVLVSLLVIIILSLTIRRKKRVDITMAKSLLNQEKSS